jgi:Family of unknown function (DUF6166)
MIQIAADNHSAPDLTNRALSERFSYSVRRCLPGQSDLPTNIAFVGYSAWRREENGDANLSDEQVFVVRDGLVRFLKPRNDLMDHSPDGLSWGYAGSGPAQLALAMLMEVFDDWGRVRPIYQRFKDHFVARIPQNTNWTADGADVMAMALALERHHQSGALLG